MTNLHELQQRAVTFRNDRGWQPYHDPRRQVVGLDVEKGEFARFFPYLSDEDLVKKLHREKEAVGDELSDILLWTLLILFDLGVTYEVEMDGYGLPTEARSTANWPRDEYLLLTAVIGQLAELVRKQSRLGVEEFKVRHRLDMRDSVIEILNIVMRFFLYLELDVVEKFSEKMTRNEIKYPLSSE